MWVISTPCGFLQTLGPVGQLTVPLYLFIKKKLQENQFFYLGPKIWNDLTQDIKASLVETVLNML